MLKPMPTVKHVKKILESEKILDLIVDGKVSVAEPIKPEVLKLVKETTPFPNIKVKNQQGTACLTSFL
jgi:hypothetical protein